MDVGNAVDRLWEYSALCENSTAARGPDTVFIVELCFNSASMLTFNLGDLVMTADKAWNLTWQAALKLIGVMNSAIVLIRGFRQNDSAGWMSAFTVLLTIVCIWVVSARLQKEISCAVADVEGHQMLRLKSNVSYLELFANVAIVAALSFAH